MVNVSNAVKEEYRKDSVYKKIKVTFTQNGEIPRSKIIAESLKFEEILCSSDSMHFGECNNSTASINIVTESDDFLGDTFTITLTVLNTDIVLGNFIVTDVKNVEGKPYKEIVGTSIMERLNVDITSVYDAISFPATLKQIRDTIFENVGISQETVTLPMDNLTVSKNWFSGTVNAKTVIESICELNGRFGVINKSNFKFTYLDISQSPTLDTSGILKKNVIDSDFVTTEYDGVLVIDDYGTTYKSNPTCENPYVLSNNACLYGKTATELAEIMSTLLTNFTGKTYSPVTSCIIKGQPYVEVGDKFSYGSDKTSYVLKRSLSGIQSMTDTISASGTQKSKYDPNTVSNQLVNLNKSTGRLKIDMSATQDGVQIAVSKSEQALQVAEGISVGGVNLVDYSYYFGCVELSDIETITDGTDNLRDGNNNIIFE